MPIDKRGYRAYSADIALLVALEAQMYLGAVLDGVGVLIGPFEFNTALNSAAVELGILNLGDPNRVTNIKVVSGFEVYGSKVISVERFYAEIVLGHK